MRDQLLCAVLVLSTFSIAPSWAQPACIHHSGHVPEDCYKDAGVETKVAEFRTMLDNAKKRFGLSQVSFTVSVRKDREWWMQDDVSARRMPEGFSQFGLPQYAVYVTLDFLSFVDQNEKEKVATRMACAIKLLRNPQSGC